jgi:hypothetical protein
MITAAVALAALATPASLFVVGGSTVAGAATPKSLVCTGLSGNAKSTVTISKCAVPTADKTLYASASAKASALLTGGTITWTSSKKTTIFKIKVTSTTGCAAGDKSELATGSVTGGTAASAVTSVGQKVSLKVCVSSTDAITLFPHTTASI